MADKDFVIKNGLTVNTSLIYANSTSSRVGIGNTSPDAVLTVTGTANVQGAVQVTGTFGSNGAATFGNTISVTNAATFSNTIAVTGAATLSNTIGVTGSATFSNSVSVTGALSTSSTLTSTGAATFSNTISVTNTATFSNTSSFAGLATFTTGVNATSVSLGTINATSNGFYANSTAVNIGNATVNSTLTSTSFSGTANNASYLGTQAAANFVNTAQLAAGTANNTLYLGGAAASVYVNTSGSFTLAGPITVSGTTNLSGPVTIANTFQANGSVGTAGQVLVSSGTGANAYWTSTALSANNASYLGGTAAASYQLNSTLSANVATLTANNSAYLGGIAAASYLQIAANTTLTGNMYFNATNTYFNPALYVGTINATSNGIYLLNTGVTPQILIGNATVNAVMNSTVYSGTSNNASYLGGAAASAYVNTSGTFTISGQQTFSALTTFNGNFVLGNTFSANGSVGTAGYVLTSAGTGANTYWAAPAVANTTGGTGGVQYYNGTNLGSSLGFTFSASSNTLNVANAVYINAINATANGIALFVNSTSGSIINLGNATVNSTVNSTIFTGTSYTANNSTYLGGAAASAYVNTSGAFTLGGALTLNATLTPNTITAGATTGTAGYVLTSNGSSPVYWAPTPATANSSGGTGSIQFYNGTGLGSVTGLLFYSTNSTLSVANNIFIGNATSNAYVNSTIYTGTSYTANNSSYLNGVAASSYAQKTDVHYIGTTSIALNRASASIALTGITSIDGSAATFTSTSQNSQFNSIGVGTAASAAAGEIRATNNVTAYYSSDISFKENIKNIDDPLTKVLSINGVEFDWTDEYIMDNGGEDGYFIRKHDIGVIAQEIEAVLPEIVATRTNGKKAVKYDRLTALLIEAIKELTKKVNYLENKLNGN